MPTTESRVRLADPQDAAAIAEMSHSYIEQDLGWSWTPGRVLGAIGDRESNVGVISHSSSIAAFGIMQYRDETAHLSLLAVQPAHRRQGLASTLMTWLEKPAVLLGVDRIRLEVRVDNPQALAFYKRLGYLETRTVAGYYSGIIDAVRLEKKFSRG
ncbi:MAG: GNAT family N-acetyltransferase [Burkholderiales bacterium]|nr:GNAT family N-acetyltransferase [Burkholderiales bacterium]